MAEKLLVDINQSLHELCAERGIPIESVRFFGSRSQGAALTDSDVDVMLVSPASASAIFAETLKVSEKA